MNELQTFYSSYDEEARLNQGNASRVEFLTTVRFLEPLLKTPGSLLDVGAGTGRYSTRFVGLGHSVTALDIVPKHVEAMNEKRLKLGLTPAQLKVGLGDATDLTAFDDSSFDTVLCLGPLYHLEGAAERARCIAECLRVLKPGGIFAAAYTNRFAFPISYLENFKSPFDVAALLETGDCVVDSFYMSTPQEMDVLLSSAGLKRELHLGSDGIAYALREQIDQFDHAAFERWLDYHYRTCSEPSILGYSMHGLWVGSKR